MGHTNEIPMTSYGVKRKPTRTPHQNPHEGRFWRFRPILQHPPGAARPGQRVRRKQKSKQTYGEVQVSLTLAKETTRGAELKPPRSWEEGEKWVPPRPLAERREREGSGRSPFFSLHSRGVPVSLARTIAIASNPRALLFSKRRRRRRI